MLVSIVGADGSGKSTLVHLFSEYCKAKAIDLKQVDRWDILDQEKVESARFIEKDLKQLRTCVAEMPLSARFRFLTWAMSISLDHAQKRRKDNEILLFDSYWYKHAAAEMAYGAPINEIIPLTQSLPDCDLVLYLKVSPHLTLSRIKNKLVPYECGMDPSCSEHNFIKHQNKIIESLDAWSKKYNWQTLDATQTPDQLIQNLLNQLASNQLIKEVMT